MQKTNFKTRLLALLTAAFMLVMCVPFAALADDPDMVAVDLVWDKDQVEVTDLGSFVDDNGYVWATVKAGGAVKMPTVKGINGYEFKGWTNVGNKTELTLADVTPYLGAGKMNLQLSAIAEKAPVVADTIVKVDVLVDTNTMKITNYGDFEKVDDGYATANFDKVGKALNLPTVEGINGYTFTGWDNAGTATSLTTEQAQALCADGKTTAVLNAQAKAPEATKFEYYIHNTDKNGHVDVLGDAQVQHLTFDNGTETLPLPYDKITANDGYKFDGWKISVQPVEGSAKEFTVPAGTQSFSIKEYGELTLVGASAIFSKVETPVTYFDYTIQNASKNGKVAVLGDEQIQTVSLPSTTTVLDLPYEKITANDGYVFAGWTIYVQPKNGNADKFVVKAGTKSVDVSKYGDLALAGASAIFEKKTDDKKDNSTSSSSSSNNNTSSSSSSSNKTTTASNQKQVVKAAAAPANTTKVLPKTGASNVAPLLGGSLAVVALLMGYGVYGLVLRKKD